MTNKNSSKDQIKISIIVPVYNPGDKIIRCAESLINQTYQSTEIIFIDDGSTDESSKYLDGLINHPNVIVYHKENGGVQSARRKGLELATGNYVTFVDSDDYVDTIAYQECADAIAKFESDLVIFRYREIYSEESSSNSNECANNTRYTQIEKDRLYDNFMCNAHMCGFLWNKVWKTEILKNIDFSDEFQICEDAVYVWDSLMYVNCATIIEKPLYNYRILFSSMTRKSSVVKYMAAADSWNYLQYESEKIKSESSINIGVNKINWYIKAADAVVFSKSEQEENKRIIKKKILEADQYVKYAPNYLRLLYFCIKKSWEMYKITSILVGKAKKIAFFYNSRIRKK